MAQTLEQRRRNAKFLKEQESKMGKSEDQIKARQKAPAPKVPVSPFWIILLGFVVFGGLFFEVMARWLGQ